MNLECKNYPLIGQDDRLVELCDAGKFTSLDFGGYIEISVCNVLATKGQYGPISYSLPLQPALFDSGSWVVECLDIDETT